MEWFIEAAEPYARHGHQGRLRDHHHPRYESKTLAPAFTEITGIKVKHDIIQEGDVIEKLQTQMQSGQNVYDAYVNDSDLIGTHFRYRQVLPLTDWMAGEGKDVTLPTLDVDDFIGKSFTTGARRQALPAARPAVRQPLLVPLRLVRRRRTKEKFKAKYGYELGVPVNWSAYEDIADFFTNDVKNIDGVRRSSATWTTARRTLRSAGASPTRGCRMAGDGDKGIPNGLPVDEWGIRVDGCHPAGSCVDPRRRHQRPGRRLRADQVRRLDEEVRPAGSAGHDLLRSRPGAGAGRHRPADLLVHRLHRRHDQAGPAGGQRRRHAEVAHGPVARTAPTGRRA